MLSNEAESTPGFLALAALRLVLGAAAVGWGILAVLALSENPGLSGSRTPAWATLTLLALSFASATLAVVSYRRRWVPALGVLALCATGAAVLVIYAMAQAIS